MKKVVSAQSGFCVLVEDKLAGVLIKAESVIAWDIERTEDDGFNVEPITIEGNAVKSNYFGILCPDGRVETPSMIFGSFDEAEAFSKRK